MVSIRAKMNILSLGGNSNHWADRWLLPFLLLLLLVFGVLRQLFVVMLSRLGLVLLLRLLRNTRQLMVVMLLGVM